MLLERTIYVENSFPIQPSDKKGPYPLYIQNTTCPFHQCDGSGIVVTRETSGLDFAHFCACRDSQIAAKKMEFAEIPKAFAHWDIDSFDTTLYSTDIGRQRAVQAKKAAFKYVEHFADMQKNGKGLYLYGCTKGSGKTRMAASIGNALIQHYHTGVKFVNTINLLQEIKKTFGTQSPLTSSELLQGVKKIDVLILDDLGTERPTSWVQEMFFNILNDRMVANKVTIFTSNCSIDRLQHDDRIKSRIEKMAFPLAFPEESIRLKIAQQENKVLQDLLFG